MAAVPNIAICVLSNLLRLVVFLFLQIVPSPLVKPLLSSVVALYVLALWLSPSETSSTIHVNGYTAEKSATPPKPTPPRHSEPLSVILFSLPTTSRLLKRTNLAINVLLLLCVAEFVAYPFIDSARDVVYTRVGAVYSDRVKITARYPLHNITKEDMPYIVWREAAKTNGSWLHGPAFHLSEDNDWVDTVQLSGLWPGTSYEYQLSSNGSVLPYPSEPIPFRTFPDSRLPAGSRLRFVVTSCLIPNFPYVPFQGRRIKGFDLLADYLYPKGTSTKDNEEATSPARTSADFMLFLGDFVYADVPVYVGNDRESYRRLYRRNYQSPSFRKIYEKLPMFHAYDDHEIMNNYAGKSNDSLPPFINATDAFTVYSSNANYDSPTPGQHYFDFRYGDTAFFVLDTRRHRTRIADNIDAPRTMLGETQLDALQSWLVKVNHTAVFKFVVSSVPFTSLWGHDAQTDSWAGYVEEKTALLSAMHTVPNVYVLSGDRHEFAAIEFTGAAAWAHPVREFSTSPLSMFYIPIFRTLRMESEEKVIRDVRENLTSVRKEKVPKERVLKYIPRGNYKWSTIDIDTTNSERPSFKLETVVDGASAYTLEIVGTPVKVEPSMALGSFVPTGIKDILNKFGLRPNKWF